MRSAASGFVCTSVEIACKRVEEEMRVQFRLQRLQLRLNQPRLEGGFLDRARLRLSPVVDRVAESDDRGVRHQQPIELHQVLPLRERRPRERRRLACRRPQRRAHHHHAPEVNHGEEERGQT